MALQIQVYCPDFFNISNNTIMISSRYCSSNSNVHSLNEMTDKTQNQYLDISQSGSCKEYVKKSSYAFSLVFFFLQHCK